MADKVAKKDDFVHVHTHSDMSQLDGAGRVSEYVKEAAKRGNPAIAFTDHGTMRGYMAQYEACKDQDIKPIYGTEFYVSPDMRRKGISSEEREQLTKDLKKSEHKKALKDFEEREGIRDRWHLNVWAKSDTGLKNLYRLNSAAFIEGFYYKPRIDLAELKKYSEGLVASTGCLSSPIHDSWQQGNRRFALQFADELYDTFGEDLRLELQPHAIRDQRVANKLVLKLHDRYGAKAPLIAAQDAHYIHQRDSEHHEVLLCIGTGNFMDDPERFKFDGDQFHMRTRKEMYRAFRRHHEFIPKADVKRALDATMDLADITDAKLKIDYHAALLPPPKMPARYKGDDFSFLRDLCLDGWRWRDVERRSRDIAVRRGVAYGHTYGEYAVRLRHELRALRKQRFVPYFLIIRELYAYARGVGIMCGPGRGSVGGSLIAYLLGMTAVDPIEHGLIFERFINPFRIDMPDIDMDFEDRRRHEIMEWLVQRFGRDNVAQIATLGKLSGKQCLRDVSRVLQVPLPEVNAVTNSIIERSSGDERASQTIKDSFKDFEVCREFNKRHPKVLHHANRLEGLTKNLGIHAAGIVTSPEPLTGLLPLEIRKHDGKDIIVTALDMYGVAALGLVKLDVLGLRTLTVIKECLEAIEFEHGLKLNLEAEDFDLNDPKTLQAFTDHDYGGVFQYDTPGADKVCTGVEFTSFEDIAAMTALNRPGTARSGLATKFVERKKNPKLVKKVDFHPKVSEITADTLGIIVYQEHVIRIFTECAGFAPGTADSLRKTIAKKIGDETLGKEREKFVEGCAKTTGIDEKTANRIMDAITFFGSYGFNKSHATEYGMIAYWCMWLKTYYPLEFYWSLLKSEPDRIRIAQLAKDAKKHDIQLLPPHVNVSSASFAIDRGANAIRGSLVDIKGVGPAAAASVMEHQPFTDFWDYIDRIDKRKVHRGVALALAKAGAFSGMLPSTKWFVEHIEDIWKEMGRKRGKPKEMFAEAEGAEDYDEEDMSLLSSSVNPLAFGKHPIDAYGDFIKRVVKVPIVSMSDENFFKDHDDKGTVIAGVVVEVKYNQVGDFHTGRLPTETERRRMFWGARYANVNIEDAGGKQNRTKFDIDIFNEFRPLIDSGVGTPVLAHVLPNARFENLRAQFAVDLGELRKKLAEGTELTVWEMIFTGEHPAKTYPWKNKDIAKKRITNGAFHRSTVGGVFTGVVTHVKIKYDKRENMMAFFGLLGGDGRYIDVIAFSSVWQYVRKAIRPGRLIRCAVEKKPDRGRGWSHFCGDHVRVMKKAKGKSAASAATT